MSSQGEELKPLNLPERNEYTHRAHRFPGKFHPPLIAQIIQDHPEHEVIADPMCGSGTLGVEAAVAGKDAFCTDIDPLCTLMTRAKTHPVNPEYLLEIGEQIVEEAGPMPDEGVYTEESAREELEPNLDGTPFTIPYNVFHWFDPHVAVGYSRLLLSAYNVLSYESREVDEAVRTALAAMVRQISRADPEPVSGLEVTKIRRKELEEGIDFNVVRSFNQVLNRLANGYRELPPEEELGTVEVVQGNSKNFATECGISPLEPSMIITSPPYCNAIEYSRRHRLEYEWLGLFNDDDVDNPRSERIETSRDFFGSTTPRQSTLKNLPDVPHEEVRQITASIEADDHERKANLLRKYFLDAYDWIGEIYETLPEEGLCCLIVGPSTSYGRTIDTPSYLTDIAVEVGFELVSEQKYMLKNNKMQYPTDGATTETESLVKLKK